MSATAAAAAASSGASGWAQAAQAAAASGATATAGGLFGMISNKKQREYNERMIKESRQWQEDMYNKYSSPEAMKNQYIEAGINPIASDLGSGQSFSTDTNQEQGRGEMSSAALMSGMSNYVQLLGQLKQNQLMDAQISKTNAEDENIRTLTEPQKALLTAQSKAALGQIQNAKDANDINRMSQEWQRKIAEGNLDVTQKQLFINAYNSEVANKCLQMSTFVNATKGLQEVKLLKLQGEKVVEETANIKQLREMQNEQWNITKPLYERQQRSQAYGNGPMGLAGTLREFSDNLSKLFNGLINR